MPETTISLSSVFQLQSARDPSQVLVSQGDWVRAGGPCISTLLEDQL